MSGSVTRYKANIPPQLLKTEGNPVLPSQFVFDETSIMVLFIPKKIKALVLVSTMYMREEVGSKSRKPDIIIFYNDIKVGIDVFFQLCHSKL
jgi:hypothetical protein